MTALTATDMKRKGKQQNPRIQQFLNFFVLEKLFLDARRPEKPSAVQFFNGFSGPSLAHPSRDAPFSFALSSSEFLPIETFRASEPAPLESRLSDCHSLNQISQPEAACFEAKDSTYLRWLAFSRCLDCHSIMRFGQYAG
jgi:hypothetical protein